MGSKNNNYYEEVFKPKLQLGWEYETLAINRIIKFYKNEHTLKCTNDDNRYDFKLSNGKRYDFKPT